MKMTGENSSGLPLPKYSSRVSGNETRSYAGIVTKQENGQTWTDKGEIARCEVASTSHTIINLPGGTVG